MQWVGGPLWPTVWAAHTVGARKLHDAMRDASVAACDDWGCAGAVLPTPRFRGVDEISRGSEESPSPKTSYKHRTSTTFCAPPLSTALLLGCERSNPHLLG